MKSIKSILKRNQRETAVKNYTKPKPKKPCINLPKGVYVIDEEGYIEGEKTKLEENTKDFLNTLFVTYGSALVTNGKLIHIAVPLKCSERTTGRPSYRVGVFGSHLAGWSSGSLADWLKKAESKIKKEVNETTNGFIEFYDSAKHVFGFPNIYASESGTGYTLMNVVFENKGIETGISGLLATDILIRKEYPVAFYICNEDEEVQKWDFNIIVSKGRKKNREEYLKVYNKIEGYLQSYAHRWKPLEHLVESALKGVDFYPIEYAKFLLSKGNVDELKKLYEQGKVSKEQLEQVSIDQKLTLIEKGVLEFSSENIEYAILEKDRLMLKKIPPSKILLTLDYSNKIKSSEGVGELLGNYLIEGIKNKSIKEIDDEIKLVDKLLKDGLFDDKVHKEIFEMIINKIESKNDLRILLHKVYIKKAWRGKIKKRWEKLFQEVMAETENYNN